MKLEEMKELIKEARSMGLTSVVIDGVELKFEKEITPIKDPVPDQKIEEFFNQPSPFDNMSEEEILYWSSPYYDDLQRNRQLREDAIKTGKVEGE